jgi:hypothetical protein
MNDASTRSTDRVRSLALFAGLASALAAATAVYWPGCRTFPPLSSDEGHRILLRLNTATSSRDPEALDRAEKSSDAAFARQAITEAEHVAFAGIIATARTGDWQAAHASVWKFLEDQVDNPGVGTGRAHD